MGTRGSAVAIGIDAAVVADHHVIVRQRETKGPGTLVDEFKVPPTLAGMERLAKKLSAYPGAVAVAEPTSMTWLSLALALEQAGSASAAPGPPPLLCLAVGRIWDRWPVPDRPR